MKNWCINGRHEIHIYKLTAATNVMGKESLSQMGNGGVNDKGCSPIKSENSDNYSMSSNNMDKEAGLVTCRVCQCNESDKRGDVALTFLGITPPLRDAHKSNENVKPNCKEVFICSTDVEVGFDHHQDTLVELGCSCKNDLGLVHYACALKWFINHGSTLCEICGCVEKNIRTSDFKKVVGSLKDYEALRERTANGEPNPASVQTNSGVDPDALAAIRRQRLSEISLWFNIHNNSAAISHVAEQPSNIVTEEVIVTENQATKWAVEGTGILLATGLLTVTLAWLIAPRVGKKTAKSGLHILLGGICALTVVVFFRFIVLTRIKYGPARYWAILFVFWFLVFGIWASRTHGAHST